MLGVVLAAGALSLAELAIEPNGGDGASEYVRESVSVTTEPAPDPSASDAPEGPGPVDGPSVLPATDSHPAEATGTRGATGEARPASSDAASAPASTAPSDSADPSSSPTGETPGDPSDSPRPSGKPTKSTPPAPPTPSPTPTPTPSEPCWLWFCW